MRGLAIVAALAVATGAHAAPQEANGYTRYELLAPGSGAFRIVYDITAVRPGATVFFNPIRKGSVASDESVTDLATGAPLKFEVVSGEAAGAGGLPDADLATDYIEIHLARPVPPDGGEGRIRIEKTYVDPKSYRVEGLGPWFRKEDEQLCSTAPSASRRTRWCCPPDTASYRATIRRRCCASRTAG